VKINLFKKSSVHEKPTMAESEEGDGGSSHILSNYNTPKMLNPELSSSDA
jgi:hypothetical protein